MRFSRATAVAAFATLPATLAQTFTDCNPLEKTCPKNDGLTSATFETDFAKDPKKDSWSKAAWTQMTYNDQGAQFEIAKKGQAPTIETDFYFFFGRVDVTMKPAPGQGIISSIVLESDDLDEIDWEFLGGVDSKVQTNFFGKGNTTSYDRMIEYDVAAAQETFHTYSLDWTSERLQWIIDGTVVRELKYTDPVALGGKVRANHNEEVNIHNTNHQQTYPQTPMRLKLGNWAGGAEGNAEGTIQWAGGLTDFTKAPFNMYVKEVSIMNANPADSYEYGDKTGSWQSIKINKDGSSSDANGGSSDSASTSSLSNKGLSSSTVTSSTASETESSSNGSVEGIDKHTEAANSVTQTGSMYSTNTASASALNSEIGASTMNTVVSASTQVPGSVPTGYSNGTWNSSSHNGSATSGASAAEQTTSGSASLQSGLSIALVAGLALGVSML